MLSAGDCKTSATGLLQKGFVEVAVVLFEGSTIKAIGENRGVTDDIVPGNQFFHASVGKFLFEAGPDSVGLCLCFLTDGFPFVQCLDAGDQFILTQSSYLLWD